ncbi:MAG: PBP1A family penicillin-binding protein [Nitrospinaceae bacterium]|nr:PBP1A family penicillin-binding protein [Nitrospinaceae bacterium]
MIRRMIERVIFGFYVLALLGTFAGVGAYFVLSRDLPQLPDDLKKINLSLPTEIYSADGERIKILGQRYPVKLEDISPNFIKAIVAAEDSGFYKHKGLDHLGLLRALYTNIRERRVLQGGSTITQQLSKNLFFSFERNWIRKIKELLVSLQLEVTFSKDQILEAYSNQIYFGSGAYGVEEASQVYFRKRARDLTVLQGALLAGLPNSPNNANPFTDYQRSMRRAEYILTRMVKERLISAEEKNIALASPLELTRPREDDNPNRYFINYVIEKLERDYGKEFVHFGGLKVFTTLDARLQGFAQKSAVSHLEALESEMKASDTKESLQVGMVSIENQSGAVRVMLGGRNYSHSQFNRAVSSNRLPGSSFKPFVYFTAMEQYGYNPASIIKDEPITIDIPGTEPWEPKNFNDVYAGDIILKKAMMRSLNVVSAKLIQEVTPEKVIKTAKQFGVTSPLGKNLSLALGTSGVSVLEMASAYSMIANLGVYNEPYFIQRIEDYKGNTLYENFYHGIQRYAPKSIYPLLNMMQGVVDGGTGRVVRRMGFKHPAAGKTGTTNNSKDAWFNGFTKDYSTSVWVGFDNNDPMVHKLGHGLTGGKAAAPIWVFYMQQALQGRNPIKFPIPEGIKFEKVDVQSGTLVDDQSVESMNVALKEEIIIPPRAIELVETLVEQAPVDTSETSDLNNVPNP